MVRDSVSPWATSWWWPGRPRAGDRGRLPVAARRAVGHRAWTAGYRVATAVVVGECAVGGAVDLLRLPPFYPMMIDLGYPGYLATIMGSAKLLAAVVLAAPRLPRLKEWAYAGVVVNMVGAAASHLAAHHSPGNVVAPAAFAALTVVSWALRPPSRHL